MQSIATGNGGSFKITSFGLGVSLLIAALLYFLILKNSALTRAERKAVLTGEHKNRFSTNMTH
jgi:hypothetical protein